MLSRDRVVLETLGTCKELYFLLTARDAQVVGALSGWKMTVKSYGLVKSRQTFNQKVSTGCNKHLFLNVLHSCCFTESSK
jgi:hypothetical protein